MKNNLVALAILLMAGLLFAPGDPFIGNMFHKADCMYSPYFSGLFSNGMAYSNTQDTWAAFMTIRSDLQSEYSAMQGCEDTGCVVSHYSRYMGYMHQAQALFMMSAFDGIQSDTPPGVTWYMVLMDWASMDQNLQGCLSGQQNNN